MTTNNSERSNLLHKSSSNLIQNMNNEKKINFSSFSQSSSENNNSNLNSISNQSQQVKNSENNTENEKGKENSNQYSSSNQNFTSEEQSLNSNQKLSNLNKSNKVEKKKSSDKESSFSESSESDSENLSNELINFKNKTKCSYYEYGNYPIYQRVYYCDVCDPNSTEKICEECYKTCHGKCVGDETDSIIQKEIKTKKNIIIIDEEEINKKNENKFFSFICSCGLKRHVLNQKDEYIKFNYCVFLELDIKLHNKAVYSCESCGLTNLCYICYLKCHGGKSNCQIHKSITNNPNINKNKICLCNNQANHCNRIILNKFMNYIFNNPNNYDTIPFVWKGQILNCVFDGSIYELLYEKIFSFILSYHLNVTKFDEKKIDDSTIDNLARFVINITKTKKLYYLHENLIKVIPMSNLILLINSFKDDQLVKFAPFISGLLQLFLVLHLKRDFQEIKSLCYRDFLLTNVLERINMRLIFNSNFLYTNKIYSKYTNDNNFIIPQICIDFCGILNEAVEVFEENQYDKLIINYLVILEIIYFCVKRFLFDKKELMKLTKNLEKFSISFNTIINLLLKDNSDINNFNAVRKAVDYFSKIIYIIMINFNDIIINEKLNEKNINNSDDESEDENNKFIHYNSPHSKILFKMIISTSIVFNTLILDSPTKKNLILKNNQILDMLSFTNKILETFTLSDNLYFLKMNEIQYSEFEDINNMKEYILNREKLEEELQIKFVEKRNFTTNKDRIDYLIENDSFKMAVAENAKRNLQNSMLLTTYNSKVRLECLLNLYFCSKIEYEQLDKKFHDILLEFAKNWTKEDMKITLDEVVPKKLERKKTSIIIKNKKTIIETQQNNYKTDFPLIREKLIKDYLREISKLTKKYFPNLTIDYPSENVRDHEKDHYEFKNSKYISLHTNIIVRELMISGFDNTLTKLFIIDPVMKRYTQETIEIIFHFLLFFTLTKESLIHFLIGRNLSRIIEIFKTFPKITLYFLVIISKGIYLYDIDLKNHKQIPNLLNLIYVYIRDNINKNYDIEHNENNIQDCVIYTMDILYYLSFCFEIESLSKINELIVKEISKLINKNKVIQMFSFEKIVNKYKKLKNENIEENEEKEFEEEEENEGNKDNSKNKQVIKEHKTYSIDYIKKLFINASKKQINQNIFPFREIPFIRKRYVLVNTEEKEKFKNTLFWNQTNDKFIGRRRSSVFYTTLNKNNVNLIPKLNIPIQTKKSGSFIKLKDTLKQLSHSIIDEEKSNSESNESSDDSFPEIDSNEEDKNSELSHKHFAHYQSKIIQHSQKLFFSLIKLLSNITYFFVMKNNVFNTFVEINDLKFYQLLLSENYLALKNRTTLLIFIRMVYINDQIEEDNTLFLNKYMNSQEYSQNLTILRNLIEDDSANYLNIPIKILNDLTDNEKISKLKKLKNVNAFNRFENLNNLKIVIEIFIHEMKNLLYYIYIEDDIDDINSYLTQILISIKIVSDVFITYEISSHMTLWLYELTKEFLNKVEFFINYFNNIKEKLFINNINIGSKSRRIEEMEKKSFDIYNMEKIYGIILEAYQEIYDNTNFNQNFKLNSFISNYYNRDEKNFKNFTLNKTEIPFYNFEQEENTILNSDHIKTENKEYKTFSLIRNSYLKQFNNFFKTTFYDLICCSSYDLSFNYNQLFLNYCVVYIFNLKNLSNENMITFLTMLNKLLIYEPSKTQNSLFKIFEQKNKTKDNAILDFNNEYNLEKTLRYEEYFFNNLGVILREKININIVTSKNIVIYERYEEINYTTKILIQFFQLLGECHNKAFHNLIITGKINENSNNKCTIIFNSMCFTLRYIINCFNRCQSLIMKSELPFDKLLVLALNINTFIIEYFQGTSLEKYKIMYDTLKQIFPSIKTFLFYKSKNEEINKNILNSKFYKEKRNFIFTMKINLLDMISSLIEEGNADNPSLNTIDEIIENFSPVDLYEESVRAFIYMNNTMRELKNYSIDNENILPILMDLYKYNDNFQDSIELKWSLRIFYYLRVLTDNYGRADVKSFLDSFKHTYVHNKMKTESEIEKEEILNHKNTLESSRRKKKYVSTDKESIKSNQMKKIKNENTNYIVYQFLSRILTRIEIKADNNESKKDFSFFVIPSVCFLLSNQSMKNFDENVDRDSVHSKIINLIKETDYFICEMFFNNYKFRDYSKFSKILSSINIRTFEIINYILIIFHNLLLAINFYSIEEIEQNKKNDINIHNFYLSIGHIIFIVIVIIVWFYYMFRLQYIHNIMTKYNVNYCFREVGDKNSHYNIFDQDMIERINNISDQISFSEKLSTIIFDSVLMNRQINMLIATLICLSFYLLTGSAIAIAVPVLFLANMVELLYGIFLTIRIRWSQLLLVLTYSFLIEYLFAIFAFYFFNDSFNFTELYNVKNDTQDDEEQMCGSIFQCYLTLLSYGGRSGGGIGDMIVKLAYNPSSGAFIARFFFDITFHIIVVLIMTNLIFGIVVDSFAAFRNKTDEIIADKNNVCFICQMSRDDAINKNIDFDLHRETVHNYWNYIYFLTYLHINNENNFKMLESSVWDKLLYMDTSWIPIMEDDKEEKTENTNSNNNNDSNNTKNKDDNKNNDEEKRNSENNIEEKKNEDK